MRRIYWIITPLLLALALFALVVLWRDGHEVRRAITAPHDSIAEPQAVTEATSPARELSPPLARESVGEDKHAHEAAAHGFLIDGTVVAVEADGTERRDLGGSADVVLYDDNNSATSAHVGIDRGRFTLPAGPHDRFDRLAFDVLVLEGSMTEITGPGAREHYDTDHPRAGLTLPIDALHHVEVRVTLKRTRLHVIDADSKRELSDVTIVHQGSYDGFPHPGIFPDAAVVTRRGVSPLVVPVWPDLDQGSLKETVFATAPGYAWGSVDVEHDLGHEYTIALGHGGDLEVVLSGHQALDLAQYRSEREVLARPRLAVYRAEDAKSGVSAEPDEDLQTLTPMPESGSCVLAGLAAGHYVVTAEIGEWFPLGHAETDIVVGKRSTVMIALAAPPPVPPLVPLAGTLFIPPAWRDLDLELFFWLEQRDDLGGKYNQYVALKAMTRVETTPGLYRWDGGKVPPGTYSVLATGLDAKIEVGPEGNDHVALTIVEPADVRLRVIDIDTGTDADVWVSGHERPRDPVTHAFAFRVPSGEQEIAVNGSDYGSHTELCILAPGVNEITMRIGRLASVRLELFDGATSVAWPEAGECEVTNERGEQVQDCVTHASYLELGFYEPGRYRITPPSIAGYVRVAPFEVQARRGETITRTIALQREH